MSGIRTIKWRFTRELIAGAPAQRGVYALWEGEQLIYLGRAEGEETIRSCLTGYLRGEIAAGLRRATHYGWEICSRPKVREAQILASLEMQPAAYNAPAHDAASDSRRR